jgi:3-hydroxyisobutyrate dehydrogenase-like beta-hydroxyacid dehydrogenase
MGTALARTLLGQGHDVVVWNRTQDRAARMVADGANLANTASEAVSASPLTIMCVLDHAAAEAIIRSKGFQEALSGRVLVQMTTVAPDQVAKQNAAVKEHDGRFVMGCIAAYSNAIGRSDAFFLYAGDVSAFDEHRGTLSSLGGKMHWLGADPCAVPAAYCSFGTYALGAIVLFLEGAALARHFGFSIDVYQNLARSATDLVLDRFRDSSKRIAIGQFAGDHASVDTTLAAMREFLSAFQQTGMPARVTEACTTQLEFLSARGDGHKDIACLTEALWAARRGGPKSSRPAGLGEVGPDQRGGFTDAPES